jgi:hypothetical protein
VVLKELRCLGIDVSHRIAIFQEPASQLRGAKLAKDSKLGSLGSVRSSSLRAPSAPRAPTGRNIVAIGLISEARRIVSDRRIRLGRDCRRAPSARLFL